MGSKATRRFLTFAIVVAALGLVGWNQARLSSWPFRSAFPRYISWCDRDYEGGSKSYDGDVRSFRAVGNATGGGVVMAFRGPSCRTISPTVILVENDGEYRAYGLLGGP